jgi:uncharacterized protein (DUF362 family)/ferredoxin
MSLAEEIKTYRATTNAEITAAIEGILASYEYVLPKERTGSIVIKPNLNSNMNALTGNTTDLRILASLVKGLKSRNYSNITIAEGTNSGFYRQGINVISRLKVDALAQALGVKCRDTNYDQTETVRFEDGVEAEMAKTYLEASCFINVPKLKMHYETLMSVCLKSLIGTLAGMQNKHKTHYSLIKNICNLNAKLKPTLHIVDAVIAMEGTGPTTGTPINTGIIMAGTNPYLLDMAAAEIAHVDFGEVPVLVESEMRGLIADAQREYVKSLGLRKNSRPFKRPELSLLTRIVTHKKYQKYFQRIRHAPLIGKVFDEGWGNKLLFKLRVTQEVMISKDSSISAVKWEQQGCNHCGTCSKYCPMGLSLPGEIGKSDECIKCLYCYSVCPSKAVSTAGDLGFFQEQKNQYDEMVKENAKE